MARITMTEVILDQSQIAPLVSESEPAGMAQHVRMDMGKAGPFRRHCDDPVHGLPGQGMAPFGDEQPGEVILAQGEPATKGAQFVAGDRLLDGQPILEPGNPKPGLGKVDIVTAQRNGFRHPEAMPIHHEDQKVIPDPMAALLGRLEQRVDLGLTEKITPSFVGICSLDGGTLYISPLGHAPDLSRNSLIWRRATEPTVYKMRVL
jgi:hypothetical protein